MRECEIFPVIGPLQVCPGNGKNGLNQMPARFLIVTIVEPVPVRWPLLTATEAVKVPDV